MIKTFLIWIKLKFISFEYAIKMEYRRFELIVFYERINNFV